jgi:hypothetical protein
MRDASGRFCKAVPEAFMDRQIEKKEVNQFETVEEGKGGEATPLRHIASYAGIVCHEFRFIRTYHHHSLNHDVMIKLYDHFTSHDLFRQ